MVCSLLLEACERRGKQTHDLAPSGHRGACVFTPHQRDAGTVRIDQFWWDFQPARFRAELNLFGRAHRLGDNIVAGKTEAAQRGNRSILVMPMALGAARRECVARHQIAAL